jgi:site-specific DNA-cytosine methylase
MGFPDSYQLPASPAAAFGVIGNAVAPLMSASLLRCLG